MLHYKYNIKNTNNKHDILHELSNSLVKICVNYRISNIYVKHILQIMALTERMA